LNQLTLPVLSTDSLARMFMQTVALALLGAVLIPQN
jgi:hypothetical protein